MDEQEIEVISRYTISEYGDLTHTCTFLNRQRGMSLYIYIYKPGCMLLLIDTRCLDCLATCSCICVETEKYIVYAVNN